MIGNIVNKQIMDNFIRKTTFTSTITAFTFAAGIFVLPPFAIADSSYRSEARNQVSALRKAPTLQKLPDELGSIETTFSVAEQYNKQHNLQLADQYYKLTIQKAQILRASLPKEVIGIQPTPPNGASKVITKSNTPAEASGKSVAPTPFNNASSSKLPSPATSAPVKLDDTSLQQEEDDAIVSDSIVGTSGVYTVQKGDSLRLVAAKLGVSRFHLIDQNQLSTKSALKPGQKLKYNNRKIIPHRIANGIVINIPDRTLYYFRSGKLSRSLPVALGVPVKNKKYDWRTPTGRFRIVSKQKDPTWYVPPSIQEEMKDEGKEVITSIPPGPKNPLGKYAIKTSLPGILIHSTTKPWSIYSYASHGCIRVYPQQMAEFFKEVTVNTRGEIIYQPVKIAKTEDGRIFLEAHRDVYGKSIELNRAARQLIERHKLTEQVDWDKVREIIKKKNGIPEEISL